MAVIGGGVVGCESATWLHGLGCRGGHDRRARVVAAREPRAVRGRDHRRAVPRARDHGPARHRAEIGAAPGRRGPRPRPDPWRPGRDRGRRLDVRGRRDRRRRRTERRRRSISGWRPSGLRANDHGYLDVDDHLAVIGGGDWLYAVGDVNGRALLTHMGKYQARIAGDVIAARAEGRSIDGPPLQRRRRPRHGAAGGVHRSAGRLGRADRGRCPGQGVDVEALEYDIGSVAGASLLRDDYAGRRSSSSTAPPTRSSAPRSSAPRSPSCSTRPRRRSSAR